MEGIRVNKTWGHYNVLDFDMSNFPYGYLVKILTIEKDKSISYQRHLYRKEIWTILSGEGDVLIEGEIRHVKSGDVVVINVMDKHSVKAYTELKILETQYGTKISENDIERFSYEW